MSCCLLNGAWLKRGNHYQNFARDMVTMFYDTSSSSSSSSSSYKWFNLSTFILGQHRSSAMVPPACNVVVSRTRNTTTTQSKEIYTTTRSNEIYDDFEDDVFTTIENYQKTQFMETDRPPNALVRKGSLQQTEKQISVDPISVRESSTRGVSPRSHSHPQPHPVSLLANAVPKVSGLYHPPLPPLVTAKPKFISSSLPNSATSSPRFGSSLLKKKWKNQSPAASPRESADSRFSLQQESYLQRSKSCGEGRASSPTDEFDLCLNIVNGLEPDSSDYMHQQVSFSKTDEANKEGQKDVINKVEVPFKCGCLFLPGFGGGKVKQVRPRKDLGSEDMMMQNVISRTVSLERFECGSWSSSAIVNDNEEDGGLSANLYYDLPMEMIRSCINDAHSPVATAFVFDKDRKVSGVLKKSTSTSTTTRGTTANESTRHVRFSTSSPTSYPASPTCITPRLRKAREEFNAFLEAQSA